MQIKRTIFSTEISGNTFRFAERTLREIDDLVGQETDAFIKKEYTKVKQIQYGFVLNSLNDVPNAEQLTVDDIKDIGASIFGSLYGAILGAQGLRLDAKTSGENLAS